MQVSVQLRTTAAYRRNVPPVYASENSHIPRGDGKCVINGGLHGQNELLRVYAHDVGRLRLSLRT